MMEKPITYPEVNLFRNNQLTELFLLTGGSYGNGSGILKNMYVPVTYDKCNKLYLQIVMSGRIRIRPGHYR